MEEQNVAIFRYVADTFELPMDSNITLTKKKLNTTSDRVKGAIAALGTDPVNSTTFTKQIITARHTKDNDKDPALMRWEILPLMETLVNIRKTSTADKGTLPERTLRELAHNLVNAPSDTVDDFRGLVALQNETIQRLMVERFEDEIEQRCRALKFLACRQEPRIAANNTLEICRLVDELIARLEWDLSSTSTDVGINDFSKLFHSLLEVRERDVKRTEYDGSKIKIHMCFSHSNPEVVNTLRKCLQEGSTVEELTKAYNDYLCAHLDTNKSKAAAKLAADLRKHKEYVYGAPEDEEGFKCRIREELTKFTAEQFRALFHLNRIDRYTYSRIQAPSLADAYVAGSLEKCHEQIMYHLHTPFYLLRAYYTIKHFASVAKWSSIDQLRANMQQLIDKLAKDKRNRKLTAPTAENAATYIKYYKKHTKKEIRRADDRRSIVANFDYKKRNVMHDIDCLANLLLMYSAVIASARIDECVEEVVRNQQKVAHFRKYILKHT